MNTTLNKTPDAQENDESPVAKTVRESITAEDEPMGEEHPVATGALVSFTYPILLIVGLLIAITVVIIAQGN